MSYKKKTIDKVIVDNIREVQVKEREEKWASKAMDAQGMMMRTTQKIVDRIANAKFVDVWSIVAVSQTRN